jgi:hypothetical protein
MNAQTIDGDVYGQLALGFRTSATVAEIKELNASR